MNYKRKSRRRFFLLVQSRTPPISSEFRGGGLNIPNPLSVRHCVPPMSSTFIGSPEYLVSSTNHKAPCCGIFLQSPLISPCNYLTSLRPYLLFFNFGLTIITTGERNVTGNDSISAEVFLALQTHVNNFSTSPGARLLAFPGAALIRRAPPAQLL